LVQSAPCESHANGFFLSISNVRNPLLVRQGRLSRHLPRTLQRTLQRTLASGARGLQPGVTARNSSVRVGVSKRASGAQGLQPGDVRSSLWRAPVGEGARRRARARRRTTCNPARCSACRRGRRRGRRRSTTRRRGDMFLGAWRRGRRLGGLNHLQVRSPAPWRRLPRRVSAWAKAWWPVALSTSGGLGLLGSSVALGSGCGEALPGVPHKAPLCL